MEGIEKAKEIPKLWLNIVSYYPFANFSLDLDEINSITKINIINQN